MGVPEYGYAIKSAYTFKLQGPSYHNFLLFLYNILLLLSSVGSHCCCITIHQAPQLLIAGFRLFQGCIQAIMLLPLHFSVMCWLAQLFNSRFMVINNPNSSLHNSMRDCWAVQVHIIYLSHYAVGILHTVCMLQCSSRVKHLISVCTGCLFLYQQISGRVLQFSTSNWLSQRNTCSCT